MRGEGGVSVTMWRWCYNNIIGSEGAEWGGVAQGC